MIHTITARTANETAMPMKGILHPNMLLIHATGVVAAQ